MKINIGQMKFDKTDIASVERGGKNKNSKMENEWSETKTKSTKTQSKTINDLETIIQKGKLTKGRFSTGFISFDESVFKNSNIPSEKIKDIPGKAKIGVYYPKNFTLDKKWPLFIAMQPGEGNGISAIYGYIQMADQEGFIIAAPEITVNQDNEISRYYYVLSIIGLFKNEDFLRSSEIWIGGFSGGAKWALQIGAYGGDLFDGILAIGCNEDLATLGYKELKNESCLYVPIYFLNGNKDEIAGPHLPYYKKMIESVKATGFKNITTEVYEGGHYLPLKKTSRAFEWFENH
jgi:hypothetical protein